MGQYYAALAISADGRLLSVKPREFDMFSKLTEHSWIGNEYVNIMYSLIYRSPKKVAWIGDYALDPYDRKGDDYYCRLMPKKQFKPYYNAAQGETPGLRKSLFSEHDFNILNHETTDMYLLNHDKKMFVPLEEYIRETLLESGATDGYCADPLPLLTACGNGRGGGDFPKGCEGFCDVGTWAFDTLEYTHIVPREYCNAEVCFHEYLKF